MIAFDLETLTLPQDGDWGGEPLGISCAAAAHWVEGRVRTIVWTGAGLKMTEGEVARMVNSLDTLAYLYGPLYTWNGAGFDFRVMAIECPTKKDKIVDMMMKHYDGMLMVTAKYGYWLGLDKVARGFNVESKLKQVTLNDGTVINDMGGAMVPELWQRGERAAVIKYLEQDVKTTLSVGYAQMEQGRTVWYGKSGYLVSKPIDFVPVQDLPDTITGDIFWMKQPPKTKLDTIAWAIS